MSDTTIKTNAGQPILVRTPEAARLLAMSSGTIKNMAAEGILKAVRVGPSGRSVRFRRADIERYVDTQLSAADEA